MKIATTYKDGKIFGDFGKTEQFKIFTVEDDKISSAEILDAKTNSQKELVGILVFNDVDVLICGGIGECELGLMLSVGMRAYPGVCGDPEEAVLSFIDGSLRFNPDSGSHEHTHHHEDNSCDEGSCNGNCKGCNQCK